MAYDLEPLGTEARQRKADVPRPGATSIRQASEKVELSLLAGKKELTPLFILDNIIPIGVKVM